MRNLNRYMPCMAMPCLKNLCPRSNKINNFGRLFIYHYYITHFHPCQGVEEIFRYIHLDVWSIFTLFTLKVSPLVQVVFVVVLRFVKIKIFSLSWIFKYQYSLKLFSLSLYIYFFFYLRTTSTWVQGLWHNFQVIQVTRMSV